MSFYAKVNFWKQGLFYRHLNGCVLDTLNRPSVLITDAFNATYVQSRRRLRDEQLMSKLDFELVEINVYSSDWVSKQLSLMLSYVSVSAISCIKPTH